MEINQSLKRKPMATVDLRQKLASRLNHGRHPSTKGRSAMNSYVCFPLFCFSDCPVLCPPPFIFRSLRVASINVRGLKDNNKRQVLFYKLKPTQYDVIYLQDTHDTPERIALYERMERT